MILGPVGRRIAIGVGANAVGKVWVALLQLISIPVLASAWGAERFGLWLIITTIPTYLALTSTAFNTVAATDISRSYVIGKFENCRATLQSVWALITAITGGVIIVALAARVGMALFGLPQWALGSWEAGDTVSAIFVYSFLVIQSAMILAAYRAAYRYAQGTLFYDFIGLFEGLGIIIIVMSGGGLLDSALGMSAIRLAGLIGLRSFISSHEPWTRLGLDGVRGSEIRRLLDPSLGALTIAGGHALAIQGVVVALGLAAGPAATASYVSMRTIARFPLQLSDLLGRATLPELSSAWFAPNRHVFWKLTMLNVGFALAILIPCSLLMLFWGTEVAVKLSKGHITYEPWLAATLGIVIAIQGLSVALAQSISAQNRQQSYGYAYLGLATTMVAIPFVFAESADPATMTALGIAGCEAIALLIIVKSLALPDRRKRLSGRDEISSDH